MTGNAEPKESPPEEQSIDVVLLAFRLGWTISEFVGRARQADLRFREKDQWAIPRNLLGFERYEAPRLSYSDGVSSRESAWWQATLRLAALADALNLLGDGFPEASAIKSWPEHVYQLTYRLPDSSDKQQSEKPSTEQWLSPRDYYEVLEPWCRKVELALSARDEMAALAFTTGGEIADTCWFMRQRSWGEPRDRRNNSWQQLLHYERLNIIIARLKVFEARLPSLVGPALRFGLFRWGFARDLGYKNGQLIVEYQWLWHWFHWWPWMMGVRRRLMVKRRRAEGVQRERNGAGALTALTQEDEAQLFSQFHEQARRWGELILGERLPTGYLDYAARFHIVWQSALIYLVLLVLIVIASVGVGYLLVLVLGEWSVFILNEVFSHLKPTTIQPAVLKDSFEILKIAVPLLTGLAAFIGGVLRAVWGEVIGLYPRVKDWLVRRKVERATWISWRARKS